MEAFSLSGTSVALDADGLGNNVTGATFTLTASSAGDDLAHKVTVLNNTANDHSGKTIALEGTDANGAPQTETLTGPGNGATVTSSKYWLTLTSATPSATIGADTFDIGWAAAAVTPTFYPMRNSTLPFNIGFGTRVLSATPTFSVQHTYGGVQWHEHAVVTGKTTATDGVYTSPVLGIRLLFTVAGGVAVEGMAQ
jgi:hypothetical protein